MFSFNWKDFCCVFLLAHENVVLAILKGLLCLLFDFFFFKF